MFGYHDSSRCGFDIWSPSRSSAVDNRAFSAYAFNQSGLDDIVNQICQEYWRTGKTDFTVSKTFDFTDDEVEYINREIQKRLG